MERLDLYRGEHPRGAVETRGVLPIGPAGGCVLNVREGPAGPGVEHGGADALGLVETVDRLHQRVIGGVAHDPEQRGDALQRHILNQTTGCLLRPGIAVMNQITW